MANEFNITIKVTVTKTRFTFDKLIFLIIFTSPTLDGFRKVAFGNQTTIDNDNKNQN